MKQRLRFLFIAATLFTGGWANGQRASTVQPVEKGMVKGRVSDGSGKPIVNAKVVIENTQFYANYVFAMTAADGNYSAKVPAGSWKASVQMERTFKGKKYRFDLLPDNPQPFAGTTGAVRNFVWKISGPRPEGGYYGGDLAVYNESGTLLMMDDVLVTLTPVGELINGSKGNVIQKSLTDIGGGEDGIRDIPLGEYRITAKRKNGKPLKIRLRNKGDYADAYTALFEAGFTGVTSYKIVVQVVDPAEQ